MIECTQSEAAAALGISTRTLSKELRKCAEAKVPRPQGRVNIDIGRLYQFMLETEPGRWAGVDYVQNLQNIRASGVQNGAESSVPPVEDAEVVRNAMVLRNDFQQWHNQQIGELKREKFNLKMMLAAAILTVVLAGGACFVLWSWWEGRGLELDHLADRLAVTEELVVEARAESDQQQRDLQDQLQETRQQLIDERARSYELQKWLMRNIEPDSAPAGEGEKAPPGDSIDL